MLGSLKSVSFVQMEQVLEMELLVQQIMEGQQTDKRNLGKHK